MTQTKKCKKCGHYLIGNEKLGATCNKCLDKAVKTTKDAYSVAEEAL